VTGRQREGNHTLQKKKNSIEDSVGNEENGYPVPDPNKKTLNVTKEPSNITKKKKKKKKLQRGNIGRNHREIHGQDTRHS
jgi:hypothetical protein